MKLYTTLTLLLFGLFVGMAQPNHGKKNKEKIRQLKIAFFTEELNLTEKEAEKFWPVYNTYDEKQHTLRRKTFTSIKKDIKSIDGLTEAKAEEILQRLETLETEQYENKKELVRKLRTFLPAKKIIRLKKAELDFNRKLMTQLKNRREKRKSMP